MHNVSVYLADTAVADGQPTYMNEETAVAATTTTTTASPLCRPAEVPRGKSIPPQMELFGKKPPVHEPRSPKSPFLRRPASVAKGTTPARPETGLRPSSSYQSLNMSGIINLAESVNKKIKEFRETLKDGSKTLGTRKPREQPKRPPRRKDKMRLSAAFATLPRNFKSVPRDLDVIEEDHIQQTTQRRQQGQQEQQEQQEQRGEEVPAPKIPQPGSSAAAELAKSKSQGDIGGGGGGGGGAPSPVRLMPPQPLVAMPGSPESSVTLSAPSHTPCAMSSLASPSPFETNGVVVR